MRNGLLLHRRLSAVPLAALALVAALASPWAAGARADAAQVTVVSPGGAEQTLALDALTGTEDVRERPYVLRSSTGESTQTVSGFSLAAILDAAGADPYGFSYLEVQRPAGGAVPLSRHQALDPGAFPDGPPLVYATAAGTGFLRPSAGPEDLNVGDSFEAPQGISVVLRKGSRLQVRAKASKLRTRPGQPVHFNAAVDGAGAGEQLAYSWYFDDGASATGPEATHSFMRRGSYDVIVGVTSDGDDTGASGGGDNPGRPPDRGPGPQGRRPQRQRRRPGSRCGGRTLACGRQRGRPSWGRGWSYPVGRAASGCAECPSGHDHPRRTQDPACGRRGRACNRRTA